MQFSSKTYASDEDLKKPYIRFRSDKSKVIYVNTNFKSVDEFYSVKNRFLLL